MSVELVYHKDDDEISPFDERAVEIAMSSDCLRIACPYLTFSYLQRIVGLASSWKLVTDVIECLTSMTVKDRSLFVSFIEENVWRIRDLSGLHAKVLIGKNSALIGSANFTTSGMTRRTEMSVFLDDISIKKEARVWFDKLWDAGIDMDPEVVNNLISKLPETQPKKQRSAANLSGDERNVSLVTLKKPPEIRCYQSAKGYYTGNGNTFCVMEGSFVERDEGNFKKMHCHTTSFVRD